MPEFFIALGIFIIIFVISVLAVSYIAFRMTFFASDKGGANNNSKITAPVVANFLVFREKIGEWHRAVDALGGVEVETVSFDSLKLRGRYFELAKGAPVEIMFHGYRGSADRDLCGGVLRAREQGRNALIVNHRAGGGSEGRVVTFGINESRDCLAWIDHVINEIDPKAKIILSGTSMGAATVMMAAGSEELPRNVVGVIADCGYTSPKEIIMKTMKDMGLPSRLLYPFVRLGGRIFGKFDIDGNSPIEALKRCHVPIVFIHGDADSFVPYEMSVRNFEACGAEKKKLIAIKGAGHGVAYHVDPDTYVSETEAFLKEVL